MTHTIALEVVDFARDCTLTLYGGCEVGTHAAKSRPISPFAAPPPFLCSRSSFLILIGSVSLATTSWKTRRVLGLPRVAALGGLELRSNCSRSIFVALLGSSVAASWPHFYIEITKPFLSSPDFPPPRGLGVGRVEPRGQSRGQARRRCGRGRRGRLRCQQPRCSASEKNR